MTKGIIRRIDSTGRIVIPIEFLKVLGIEYLDKVEILLEGNQVIVKKKSNLIMCELTPRELEYINELRAN